MSGCYYYVEEKGDVSYEDSYVRVICIECKQKKLYPPDVVEMMFHSGLFGEFDIHCNICNKVIHLHEKG